MNNLKCDLITVGLLPCTHPEACRDSCIPGNNYSEALSCLIGCPPAYTYPVDAQGHRPAAPTTHLYVNASAHLHPFQEQITIGQYQIPVLELSNHKSPYLARQLK